MKKAWIIINQYLKSNKFTELYRYFKEAADIAGINLQIYTNAEVLGFINKDYQTPDFIIFWDKDIRLARLLESIGIRLFNNADAIEACDDKYLTYLALKSRGIPTPETLPVPMKFFNVEYSDFNFINEYSNHLGYPMIIKENFGSFGEQVFLSENYEESIKIINSVNGRPLVFQKFIKESKGKDIRINIVGKKVVAAMERYSTNGDFRANLSIGGSMKKIEVNDSLKEIAINAASALNLDFCGVDILYSDNGYNVCEVNSNAHFKNIMDLTGINFAKEIFEYIGEIL